MTSRHSMPKRMMRPVKTASMKFTTRISKKPAPKKKRFQGGGGKDDIELEAVRVVPGVEGDEGVNGDGNGAGIDGGEKEDSPEAKGLEEGEEQAAVLLVKGEEVLHAGSPLRALCGAAE